MPVQGSGRSRPRTRAAVLCALFLTALGMLALLAQPASAAPPPAPTLVSSPVSPSDDPSPTWTYLVPPAPADSVVVQGAPATGTVTTASVHTGECALTRVLPAPEAAFSAAAPCNVTLSGRLSYTGSVTVDGPVSLSLRVVRTTTTTARDPLGVVLSQTTTREVGPVTSSVPYVFDGQAPVVTVTGPTSGRVAQPHYDLKIVDGTATDPVCTVDGVAVGCSTGAGLTSPALADGSHVVVVTATDRGGRSTSVSTTYLLDSVADVTLTPGTGLGRNPTPSWSFGGSEPWVSATCSLRTGATVVQSGPCTSLTSHTAAALPATSGTDYVLTVTVADAAGNTATATATYRLDTRTSVTVSPVTRTGNDPTPTWTLDGEAWASATCTLRQGTTVVQAGPCTSLTSHTAAALPPTTGTDYVLTVDVVDAAGNTATGTAAYRLATSVTLQVLPPDRTGNDLRPSWTLSGSYTRATCTLQVGPTVVQTGPCSSLRSHTVGPLPASPGTDYVLTVTVADDAGNTASATAAYRLDTVADLTVTPAARTGNDPLPTWTFAGSEPWVTATCALRRGGATIQTGPCSSLTEHTAGPLPATTGADYLLRVTVTDAAGNTATATATYHLDTVTALTVTPGAATSNVRTPTWRLTGDTYADASCVLSTGGTVVQSGPCSSLVAHTADLLPTTAGTDYLLTVTVTDAAGNTATATATYRLDTATTITITPAETVGNDRTPTWTLTGDVWASARCVLSAGATVVQTGRCSSLGAHTAATLPSTSGTDYLLTVTVTDAAGNTATATSRYRLDTVAVLGVSPAVRTGNDPTPTWTFSGDEPWTAATCMLRQGATVVTSADCTSLTSFTAPVLPDTAGADYVLTVTVTDGAGNTATATARYRLDTRTSVAVSPGTAVSNNRTPTWTFTGDTWVSATCILRAGATVVESGPCSTLSSHTAGVLPDSAGIDYVLTVTVVDAAGNTATAGASYRLDTVATVAVTPASRTGSSTTPTWTFAGSEPWVSATCTLTSAGVVVRSGRCSSLDQHTAAPLPATAGTDYLLTVTVTDAARNTATATAEYHLDTLLRLTVRGPVGAGRDRQPVWTYTDEPYVDVSCRLVGPGGAVPGGSCGLTSYTAPLLPPTAGGDYVLSVTATDAAGNTKTVVTAGYHLDTFLELTVSGPTGPSPLRTPAFAFTGEAWTSVVCTLVGPLGAVPGGSCGAGGFSAPRLATDGDYTLSVTARDAAGNERTVSVGYELDTLALTLRGPVGPSPDRRPTWVFDAEPYTAARCVLRGPAGVVVDVPCTTLSSFTAPTLPTSARALYTLTVTVTDRRGNTGSLTSPPYLLDTQPPTIAVTGPTAPGRAATVTWRVQVDGALSAAVCRLLRNGEVVRDVSCPGTLALTLPGDGTWTLSVTVVDLAGNTATSLSAPYVYDAIAPTAPGVSPISAVSRASDVVWTLSTEPGTVLRCRLLREDLELRPWTACDGTYLASLPSDGGYVLEAQAFDAVGPGPVTRASYLLDTVSPVPAAISGPSGPSRTRTVTWTFQAEAGGTRCRLLRGTTPLTDFASCEPTGASYNLTDLPDGSYVLQVETTDAAGNSSVGSSSPYVLDTTAPGAPVVTGPSGPSADRQPRFTWISEPGAPAECALSRDGGPAAFVTCSSPFAPVLGTDGTWTLTVRVTDAAGNVSAATASGGYVLDTTPPPPPLVAAPRPVGRDLRPSWSVDSEAGSTSECRLTGPDGRPGSWLVCTAPFLTALPAGRDGLYVLEVRSTDAAGNVSAAGRGQYLLDTTAPAAPKVTTLVAAGRSRTPSFSFTTGVGETARCRLTSGSKVVYDLFDCSSPATLDLTGLDDGPYTLLVRLVDAAGNTGSAGSAVYLLDTTPPAAPTFTATPGSPAPGTRPGWSFSAESGATFVCRVSFPSGAVRELPSCASPLVVNLDGLPDGSYVLSVRAVDAAGNVGLAVTDTYVLSSAAPAVPSVSGPTGPSTLRTPGWTVTGPGTLECMLTRGSTVLSGWGGCGSATQPGRFSADLFGQPDGTYVLSVRSRTATSVSSTVTVRYVLDTTPPAAPGVVAQFSPSTDRRPIWVLTGSEIGGRLECRLLVLDQLIARLPCGSGTETFSVDLDRGDGTYTLAVRQFDAAGNASLTEALATFVLNTAAPAAVAVRVSPEGPSANPSPVWTLTTTPGTTLQCRLSGPGGLLTSWDVCKDSYTASLQDQPDGTYTLFVRAESAVGTPGPETSSAYVLLRVVPTGPTTLTGPGKNPDVDRRPTFTFTLPTGTTGWCKVTRGTETLYEGGCTSPYTLNLDNQADGTYSLRVYARNAAGTLSVDSKAASYALLVQPPQPPVFTLEPADGGSGLEIVWRFSTPRGSTVECRLLRGGVPVGDDWSDCTTTANHGEYRRSLTGLPDGLYVLQVRAVSAAGRTSQPIQGSYALDRGAVAVPVVDQSPVTPDRVRTVTWAFHAPVGTRLECRLSGPGVSGTFGACTSSTTTPDGVLGSYALTAPADGVWTLEIRVVDGAGRVGRPVTGRFELDTTRPVAVRLVPGDQGPAGMNPTPSWSWDDAPDLETQCRLLLNGQPVGAGWKPCVSGGEGIDLRPTGEGSYTFEVRQIDRAGNVTASPASAGYVYDLTAPARPAFLTLPAAGGTSASVTWTFAVPRDARATCKVTRDLQQVLAETDCNGTFTLSLSGRPAGTYVLTVVLVDAAGNKSLPAVGSYGYALAASSGPVRVDGVRDPARTEPTGPTPDPTSDGPGRGGSAAAGPDTFPPSGRTGVPGAVPVEVRSLDFPGTTIDDIPRASSANPPQPGAGRSTTSDASTGAPPVMPLARALPSAGQLPTVITDVVTETIKRPGLPLALLAIVLLFLLAQNRIDRRDPKLAMAPTPVDADLGFGPRVRRPGDLA